MTEAAPGDHRDGDATCGDQGCQYKRYLVAHTDGWVLVDFGPPDITQVNDHARMEHGMSERERLIRVEPLQKTRHQEGAHLVIGDVAAEISVDEVGYFVIIQASAVSLADDEFGGIQVRHFEMRVKEAVDMDAIRLRNAE